MLAACEHTVPFRPGDHGPDAPPFSGSARLTYNPGVDWMPAWLPDGSGILYSVQRLDRSDLDRCLGLLPAGGGTLLRVACHRVAAADDSTDVFEAAAASSDGRLAYVRASSPLAGRPLAPTSQALVLATVDRPDEVRVLRTIPYQSPSGRSHQAVSQVRWLGDSALVYLGERVAYPRACSSCAPDTVRWGVEIVRVDLRGPAPGFDVVPGTDQASSLAVGGTPDTLYYTLNGDSRVYRRVLSSGATAVVHAFGAAGIARDVDVAGCLLVAVVGGAVGFGDEPGVGWMQVDRGGDLFVVDLATGAESAAPSLVRWFRRPRLHPVGDRYVADAYGYVINSIVDPMGNFVGFDTIVDRAGDLWLFPAR